MIPQGTLRVPQGTRRVPQGTFRVPQGTRRTAPIVLGSIAENAGANTVVGTLSMVALGSIVTWTLTDDANGTFVISGPKNDQVMLGWVQLDYSVATSYSITARATITSATGTTTRDFTYLIPVVPSTSPALSTPPVQGIDFRHGVTTSSGSITAVTQSWSGSGSSLTGVAANQPTLVSSGPSLQSVCQVAAGQYFTYTTTGALSAFDFFIVIAPTTSTNTLTLLAKNSSTQSFVQLGHSTTEYDRFTFRDDSAASATTVTVSPGIRTGYWQLLRVKFDGTNIVLYLNGTQVATSAAASGHTFTFSQFFRVNNAAASWTGYVGAMALYSAVQAAGDVTTLINWFEPWRRQRRFISSSTGNDSTVTGWLSGTPYSTLAAGSNISYLYYGDSVQLKAGDVWYEQIKPTVSGLTSGAYIVYCKYGAGANPQIYGVAAFAGSWTQGSTTGGVTTWTAALASDPTVGWIKTGTGSTAVTRLGRSGDPYLYTILAETAGGAAYTTTWATGTVTLNLPAGMDPNTYEIRLPQAAANATGLDMAGAPLRVYDMDSQFWQAFGARPQGTVNGTQLIRCRTAWNFDDGCGPNQNCDGYYHQSFGNGSGVHSSGHGDGWSQHGTSICTLYACWIENNDLGGIRPEQAATTTADRCYIAGNYNDVQQLAQPSGSGGGITITNSFIGVDPVRSEKGYGIDYLLDGAAPATPFLVAYNNTIVNLGAKGTTRAISLADAAGSGNFVKWNIIKGFDVGLSVGVLPVTEDYNDFFGNNTNTSGAGITSGGHSITTDPNLAANYTLQAGSPCIAAAIGSTQTIDLDGRQRPKNVTPNIGAFEYA